MHIKSVAKVIIVEEVHLEGIVNLARSAWLSVSREQRIAACIRKSSKTGWSQERE